MVRRPSRRARAAQWLLLLALLAVAYTIFSDAADNLARRDLRFGFGFLGDHANFDIPFHLISWVDADTYGRALLVSLLNTLLVSAMGIVTATLLGLFLGIMRLSVNWLMRNVALGYIEFVRNTPQLVQIIFWYFAVLQTLPPPRGSIRIPGGLLLNISGLYVPGAVMRPGSELLSLLALALVIATPFVWRLRLRARRIGAKALVLPLVAALLLVTGIERIEFPILKGFNIAGGTQIPPELVALWAGLSIYSSAFIAEIVRSAIEAVPKGQHEAAHSLGLRRAPVLFLIVLPQAMRIMVPQLTSQYLNVIKSSTLGAAVAYPEIFQIFAGTVMQPGKQGGRDDHHRDGGLPHHQPSLLGLHELVQQPRRLGGALSMSRSQKRKVPIFSWASEVRAMPFLAPASAELGRGCGPFFSTHARGPAVTLQVPAVAPPGGSFEGFTAQGPRAVEWLRRNLFIVILQHAPHLLVVALFVLVVPACLQLGGRGCDDLG